MELKLIRQPVRTSETFYDSTTEQSLECDVLLPDYCPDIQKILRCEVVPSLLSQTVSGESFLIDGMAAVQLYYLDAQGCLRHAEYKIPYTKTIELRAAPQNSTATVYQNVDYFNCRAVSQRRVDMRGAITLQIKIMGQNETEIICGATGMGVQLRRETVESAVVLPPVTRQARVYEEVELGHGKLAAAIILRTGVIVRATEQKIVSGKMITKGEALVRVLYQCEGEEQGIDSMEYSLPISQVVDLAGVEEDCSCHVWYEACSLEVSPKRDNGGENRLLAIELVVNITAGASRRVQLEAATDSYSTGYECKQTIKQVPFLELLDSVSDIASCKEAVELPSEIQSVIDLWCVAGAPMVRVEQDTALVSGKLTMKMFCRDVVGEILYFEQQREYQQRIPLRRGCESVIFSPRVMVDSTSFTITGAVQLEIRCNLRIAGELYHQQRRQVICELAVDEGREKKQRGNGVYLYYTNGQETVWDIAKRYNSPADVIRQENGLEDALPDQRMMLLIPMQ